MCQVTSNVSTARCPVNAEASVATRATRPTRRAAFAWSIVLVVLVVLVRLAPAQTPSAPPAATGGEGAYVVGDGDVLAITVYEHADLTGRYTVGADGTFSFPLIGRVEGRGLTVRAVEEALRTRLADGYLRHPQVAVDIAEYKSQRVFVMGSVERPGPVPLSGALTLLEAISLAGGPAADAGAELVLVRAPDGGAAGPTLPTAAPVSATERVNLRDLEDGRARANVVLRDGDTIFVQRAEAVFVVGQVKNPGQVAWARDMTVLRALSLAGGVTELGSTGRIRIVRIVDGEQKEIRARLTDPVRPGDTITVPMRLF